MPDAGQKIVLLKCAAILVFVCLAIVVLPLASHAGETSGDTRQLPRFASIRAKEMNLRTGPGERYPIDWVMKGGKGWPVQIVAEFDNWCRIKSWDGTTGWVHRNLLTQKRAVVTVTEGAILRRAPGNDAPPRARVATGTHGSLKKCEKQWCEIEFDGGKGWLPLTALWGADTAETAPKPVN